MGFSFTLLPVNIHQESHIPYSFAFDKVLLAQVTHFVELPKSPDLASGDSLLTVLPFRLL